MSSLTNDNRSAATLTLTSKSAATLTQDTRNVKYLWVSTTFPWQEDLPWQIDGTGNPITLISRS